MSRTIANVDMDAFFVSVELVRRRTTRLAGCCSSATVCPHSPRIRSRSVAASMPRGRRRDWSLSDSTRLVTSSRPWWSPPAAPRRSGIDQPSARKTNRP